MYKESFDMPSGKKVHTNCGKETKFYLLTPESVEKAFNYESKDYQYILKNGSII